MKIFYVKAFCKILMVLLFSAFCQNIKANNRVASIKKLILTDAGFKISDTAKHISKTNKANYRALNTVNDPPEDGVDDDIVERHKQEEKRTKDPSLNIVPVERLIQARKIKDQLLNQQTSKLKSLSSSNTISSIGWTERGPNNVGGRTRALLFDLNDQANGYKKVFAGGVGGGLWYTTDITAATVIWHKINDFFESIAVSCIAQNPVNPQEIYAGTGEGWFNGDAIQGLGVWKSSDGGITWNRLTSTSTFTSTNSILVDKNGSVYVAGVGLGIQKSSNGGTTWNQVIASPGDGADLQLAANGDIYASTGVFSTGNIFMSDFSVNGANTGNAGTWTNITPETTGTITPATQSWLRIKLTCAPSNSNIVYALFEGGNSYGLTSIQQYNKGTNTWTVKAVPPGSSFSNEQAWYSIAAAVDPNNENTLFAGSLDAVKSTDGGATWAPITQWYTGEIGGLSASQYVHADHHAYVFSPGSSGRLLMGTDGGIFYTSNANATGGTLPAFAAQNSGYNVTQFYSVALHPTNNNYALAGAQDNGTQQFSAIGLNNTTEVTGGDGADAFIDQLNGNIQITSYVYNNHWISLDNGASFTELFFGNTGSFINPSDYDSNQKNLYSGYGPNQYFRWNNVASISSPSTSVVTVSGFNGGNITSVTMSPTTSNRVYFGLDNGTVAVVNNANAGTNNASVILNPNPAFNNISVSSVAVDPASENHILVSYFNYGVVSLFETKNATAATPVWTAVEGNLPDMPVRWAMFYPGNATKALIATELGVWTTDALNGSSTSWTPSNSGLANVEVDMLTYRASDHTLAAATHGRGLFTTILPVGLLPAISYSSPHIYPTGAAIAALTPTSSGVAAPGYSNSPITTGSGFNNPYGIAVDAPGNIYVADYGNNAVKKIPAGGGAPVVIGSGFSNPRGIAIDAAGNVYVADAGNHAVKKIPVGGGSPVTLGSGFNQPYGLAVDGGGNVYVADRNNNVIKEIPAGGGAVITLGSGFTNPTGVAVDAYGNVYVADFGNSAIKKIPVGGGAPVTIGSGFNSPFGVAVDGSGNVFVTDYGNKAVKEIPISGGSPLIIGSGFNFLFGAAVDAANNIFVTDYGTNAIKEIKPVGGFYISPALPAGLSFSNTNGTISGTPTIASPAINYAVTVYNSNGGTTATLNIKTIIGPNNASLANLTLSKGTLSPVFAAGTMGYTAIVPNAISSITITPTAGNAAATIKVNGVSVASGTASASLPLIVGTNAITTVVTAQDGTTTKTYTLTLTKAAAGLSTNALLTSIKLSPVSSFVTVSGPDYKDYTTSVPNSETSLQVIAVSSDANATIKVNGTVIASGVASQAIPLNVGSNIITVLVTAQDGATTKSFVTTATRAASSNASLANLTISKGTLSPVFAAGTISYTAIVPNATSSITLTPTVGDTDASITVNGAIVASGTASASLPLAVGANAITTVVTASDGTTTKTYTLTVTRAAAGLSTNALLTSLKFSPASTFVTVSGPDYKDYTTSVPNSEASLQVIAVASDANATIKVNGTTVASGAASQVIPLVIGSNVISVVVTAQDGATTKSFVTTVTRAASPNANLANLTISSGTLSPVFATATASYTANVANAVSSTKVTPTTSDAGATVTVNGTTVASGTASASLPLAVGTNAITTVVTASDGTTTKTYTLTVTRAAAGLSTNALLTSLKFSPASTFVTVSGPDYKDYTTSVPNSEASLQVIAVASDANATIKVNGTTVASGTASQVIPLVIGSNVISVVVTAQDGATTKSFVTTVTRAAASMALRYTQITSDSLKTTDDGITVHPGLSPNGDGIKDVFLIDGLTTYPDNKVTIINRRGVIVFETKGYDNNSKAFDGHSNINGKLQQAGTYFYSLEYRVGTVNKHKTGFIILKY